MDSRFEIGCNCAPIASILILVKKVQGSLSKAWLILGAAIPLVLAKLNDQFSGLSYGIWKESFKENHLKFFEGTFKNILWIVLKKRL